MMDNTHLISLVVIDLPVVVPHNCPLLSLAERDFDMHPDPTYLLRMNDNKVMPDGLKKGAKNISTPDP